YAPAGGRGGGPGGTAAGFRVAMSHFDGTGGAGSVDTTVEDLAHWDQNFDNRPVGARAPVEALMQHGQLRNDSTINYALGIIVDKYRGVRRVWHNGSWAGYRAMFARFPDQHLSVSTLCNLTTSGPDSLALKVAAIYLDKQMEPDPTRAWEVTLASAP